MREGSVRKRRKGCGGTRTYGVCWCSPGLVMSVEEGSRTPSKYHGSFLALSFSLSLSLSLSLLETRQLQHLPYLAALFLTQTQTSWCDHH